MSTVDELFDAFRRDFRERGDVNPRDYLDRLAGADRRELTALIDAFLARAPRRPLDPATLQRLRADPLAQRIAASLGASAVVEDETWQTLLKPARERARLKRSTLVQRLAAALGVTGMEAKVAEYYHRMEQGSLEPEGVSPRVLEALSSIIGVPAERLREAGRRLAGPAGGEMPVFARTASPSVPSETELYVMADVAEDDWDEVDELFAGG